MATDRWRGLYDSLCHSWAGLRSEGRVAVRTRPVIMYVMDTYISIHLMRNARLERRLLSSISLFTLKKSATYLSTGEQSQVGFTSGYSVGNRSVRKNMKTSHNPNCLAMITLTA